MAFQNSDNSQSGRAIILSIQPRFSELIRNGTKRVEIRRAWTAKPVSSVLIYESAPTQKIVAMASVSGVVQKALRPLWEHSREMGPGLSREEFMAYLDGKSAGFAVALEKVQVLKKPVSPAQIIKDFVAPQSFRYLTPQEFAKANRLFERESLVA